MPRWPWQRTPIDTPARIAPPASEAALATANSGPIEQDATTDAIVSAIPESAAPAAPLPVYSEAPAAPRIARRVESHPPADPETAAELSRGVGPGAGDSSQMLVLGQMGGFKQMAVSLSESLATGERINRSSIHDEVARSAEAPMDAPEGDFAGSLPSLLSFSDPLSIIEGKAMQQPFGQRIVRSDAPPPEAPVRDLIPFEQVRRSEPVATQRGNRAGSVQRREMGEPTDAPAEAPRLRRFSEAVTHESPSTPSAPTIEPLVARSVPVGTEPTIPMARRTASSDATPDRPVPSTISRTVSADAPAPFVSATDVPTRRGPVALTEPFRDRRPNRGTTPPNGGEPVQRAPVAPTSNSTPLAAEEMPLAAAPSRDEGSTASDGPTSPETATFATSSTIASGEPPAVQRVAAPSDASDAPPVSTEAIGTAVSAQETMSAQRTAEASTAAVASVSPSSSEQPSAARPDISPPNTSEPTIDSTPANIGGDAGPTAAGAPLPAMQRTPLSGEAAPEPVLARDESSLAGAPDMPLVQPSTSIAAPEPTAAGPYANAASEPTPAAPVQRLASSDTPARVQTPVAPAPGNVTSQIATSAASVPAFEAATESTTTPSATPTHVADQQSAPAAGSNDASTPGTGGTVSRTVGVDEPESAAPAEDAVARVAAGDVVRRSPAGDVAARSTDPAAESADTPAQRNTARLVDPPTGAGSPGATSYDPLGMEMASPASSIERPVTAAPNPSNTEAPGAADDRPATPNHGSAEITGPLQRTPEQIATPASPATAGPHEPQRGADTPPLLGAPPSNGNETPATTQPLQRHAASNTVSDPSDSSTTSEAAQAGSTAAPALPKSGSTPVRPVDQAGLPTPTDLPFAQRSNQSDATSASPGGGNVSSGAAQRTPAESAATPPAEAGPASQASTGPSIVGTPGNTSAATHAPAGRPSALPFAQRTPERRDATSGRAEAVSSTGTSPVTSSPSEPPTVEHAAAATSSGAPPVTTSPNVSAAGAAPEPANDSVTPILRTMADIEAPGLPQLDLPLAANPGTGGSAGQNEMPPGAREGELVERLAEPLHPTESPADASPPSSSSGTDIRRVADSDSIPENGPESSSPTISRADNAMSTSVGGTDIRRAVAPTNSAEAPAYDAITLPYAVPGEPTATAGQAGDLTTTPNTAAESPSDSGSDIRRSTIVAPNTPGGTTAMPSATASSLPLKRRVSPTEPGGPPNTVAPSGATGTDGISTSSLPLQRRVSPTEPNPPTSNSGVGFDAGPDGPNGAREPSTPVDLVMRSADPAGAPARASDTGPTERETETRVAPVTPTAQAAVVPVQQPMVYRSVDASDTRAILALVGSQPIARALESNAATTASPVTRQQADGATRVVPSSAMSERDSMGRDLPYAEFGHGAEQIARTSDSSAAEPTAQAAVVQSFGPLVQRRVDRPGQQAVDMPRPGRRASAANSATNWSSNASMPFASPMVGPGTSATQREFDSLESGREPVAMPLVTPPPIARQVDDSAPHTTLAREVNINEMQVNNAPSGTGSGQHDSGAAVEPDIDELTEKVWQRIRRKLRIERERTRGIG